MIADSGIRKLIARGSIAIAPFDDKYLQPVSYDVHLGGEIRRQRTTHSDYIDLGDPKRLGETTREQLLPRGNTLQLLYPMEFILACTEEKLQLDGTVGAELDGKSTLGRIGLLVHVTAGLIDPGWRGRITLEIFNLSRVPIRLWRGMSIGQFVFTDLGEHVERMYGDRKLGSHYQGDMTVSPSRGFVDGSSQRLPTR